VPSPSDTNVYSVEDFRAKMDRDNGATTSLCRLTVGHGHFGNCRTTRSRPSGNQRGQDPPELAPGPPACDCRRRDPLSPGAESCRSRVTLPRVVPVPSSIAATPGPSARHHRRGLSNPSPSATFIRGPFVPSITGHPAAISQVGTHQVRAATINHRHCQPSLCCRHS
jgi:hypothetical protein